jgi:hypothetical protein
MNGVFAPFDKLRTGFDTSERTVIFMGTFTGFIALALDSPDSLRGQFADPKRVLLWFLSKFARHSA